MEMIFSLCKQPGSHPPKKIQVPISTPDTWTCFTNLFYVVFVVQKTVKVYESVATFRILQIPQAFGSQFPTSTRTIAPSRNWPRYPQRPWSLRAAEEISMVMTGHDSENGHSAYVIQWEYVPIPKKFLTILEQNPLHRFSTQNRPKKIELCQCNPGQVGQYLVIGHILHQVRPS